MEKGQTLMLYLDPGEPMENVPVSLKNDGQKIMEIEEKSGYFELLVKKTIWPAEVAEWKLQSTARVKL